MVLCDRYPCEFGCNRPPVLFLGKSVLQGDEHHEHQTIQTNGDAESKNSTPIRKHGTGLEGKKVKPTFDRYGQDSNDAMNVDFAEAVCMCNNVRSARLQSCCFDFRNEK